MRALLDMDGVLCNFRAAATDRLLQDGWSEEEIEAQFEAWNHNRRGPISPRLFWKSIHDGGERFWVDIPKYPWTDALIESVSSLTSDWYIATSPSLEPCSYLGKILWIKEHLGASFDRFFISPHKEALANPFTVLIDDRDENVNRFAEAGGFGLLFPATYNTASANAEVAYERVTAILQEYADDLREARICYNKSVR